MEVSMIKTIKNLFEANQNYLIDEHQPEDTGDRMTGIFKLGVLTTGLGTDNVTHTPVAMLPGSIYSINKVILSGKQVHLTKQSVGGVINDMSNDGVSKYNASMKSSGVELEPIETFLTYKEILKVS